MFALDEACGPKRIKKRYSSSATEPPVPKTCKGPTPSFRGAICLLLPPVMSILRSGKCFPLDGVP